MSILMHFPKRSSLKLNKLIGNKLSFLVLKYNLFYSHTNFAEMSKRYFSNTIVTNE